jgi:hypothetical protein
VRANGVRAVKCGPGAGGAKPPPQERDGPLVVLSRGPYTTLRAPPLPQHAGHQSNASVSAIVPAPAPVPRMGQEVAKTDTPGAHAVLLVDQVGCF